MTKVITESILCNHVVKNLGLLLPAQMRKPFERTEEKNAKANLPYIHTYTIYHSPHLPTRKKFDMQARSHLCINKPSSLANQGTPTTLTLLYAYTQRHRDQSCFD